MSYIPSRSNDKKREYCQFDKHDVATGSTDALTKKKRSAIPFYLPHKNFMEKIEYEKEPPEPLTGFKEAQKHLYKTERTLSDHDVKELPPPKELKILQPHYKVPDVIDQTELINRMRGKTDNSFVYMVYAVPRSSEHFTPYTLREVPYEEVDKKNFLTMSSHGVSQYIKGEQYFTHLSKWEAEYNLYRRLMQIKSFYHFRSWKAFYCWKKSIQFNKYSESTKFLDRNLFILIETLRSALLDVQRMCCLMVDSSFVNSSQIKGFFLFYFIEAQMLKLETTVEEIYEFHKMVKEIVSNACYGALLFKGFIVDERLTMGQDKRDKGPKLSYIEQANKQKFCNRLTCFITLADYLFINMMHTLVLNSTKLMTEIFEKHTVCLPSAEKMEDQATNIQMEEPRDPTIFPSEPLFFVNITISIVGVDLEPPYSVCEAIFRQLYGLWEEYVKSISSFIGDKLFRPFTNPVINLTEQARSCGFGPPLEFYLNDDVLLDEWRERLFRHISINYDVALKYITRLDYIHQFYVEDINTEPATLQDERVLETLRAYCVRYQTELEIVEGMADYLYLGMLNLQFKTFKEVVTSETKRLIGVLEEGMPLIGKQKVDALVQEADDAMIYLEEVPEQTLEYVRYLEFVESAPGKVDRMELELDYCKELYDIIEEFHILIPVDDMSLYLGLSVTMGNLRNLVDRKYEEMAKTIARFSERINKDISQLISEVGEVKDECLKPWLYDIESSMEEVMAFLNGLNDKLLACQKKASDFQSYQKQFRMEVTRFDMLDEVMNDLKLRILLWESLDQWSKTMDEWYSCEFSGLDTDEMNLFIAKNVKNITKLEKGLPRNFIVPKLKDDVEAMKNKHPVITYLRNPSLRQRHWLKIEAVLNYKFKTDEFVTLKLLEDLKVFNYGNEFMEISSQASSEAGLEAILKRVEESWKALEFIILPHRDAKDVFILGTLEDVQTCLDEANININTIASSKHVGPIKPRVDEWIIKLELISKTLEEWQDCQKSWIYLEAIFSAPDIQRQLPAEAKMFIIVDKIWKDIMRRTVKMPLVIEMTTMPGLLDKFLKCNALLEQIMKCLESYLETKRVSFPRFYFLSNDELLEILAQTKNPHAVQPHLRKCFDAISKLEFGMKDAEDGAPGEQVLTTDIIAMISPEGERVALGKGLKARGNIDDWLGKVEESMFICLRKIMKGAVYEFNNMKREVWVLRHPSQIVLTGSQVMWARDVHVILDDKKGSLPDFEKKNIMQLNKLAALIQTNLTRVARAVLIALITIDVHARDIVTNMVRSKVNASTDFNWLKTLRYYWLESIDNCVARMSSSQYNYGYEYIGASGVLVITPLTDRCYLCLMGALQLDLGGAPAGPAGTGKTETTKDLAKSLAIQCIVFNCSEGLDFKMMGRFFAGLAQSGAWCCFDEFNRIDIEVLSVIAQQLITIRNAKAAKVSRFFFEGREIKLIPRCAAFITMNPGYAGRTELPDNLKALFRPISMMVPDYALIAEVVLYSEGFESSGILSYKMVQMYKLCSEQLSLQDHYDFGMRAVKSVLVMAGALKRASPDQPENVVLISALKNSNLPKFLADDAILFQGILGDLFPGVELPEPDYGLLQLAIEEVTIEHNYQVVETMIVKVIQLFETMIVRWGVMLVGPTGGGKSVVLHVLRWALIKLWKDGVAGPYYRNVRTYIMNPKAVTVGELYGEVNPYTMEWRDGLMGLMTRAAVQVTEEEHQWIICDGPVDAVWIENLNTVLDDNKMLCLANSERIKLTPWVHMVFEVHNLSQASPATVSRCGMVYIDPNDLGWLPYVQSWLEYMPEKLLNLEMKEYMTTLFDFFVDNGFTYIARNCIPVIPQVDIAKATMVCKIIEGILVLPGAVDRVGQKSDVRTFLCQAFMFGYIWGIGGNLIDSSREQFEGYVRDQFTLHPDARLPPGVDLWGVYMNIQSHRLESWAKITPQFDYNPATPFFETLVPTIDTIRFGYVMESLLNVNYPVFFTGGTGVGKSVIAKQILVSLEATTKWVPVTLNFSAQTSSTRTQEIIEVKLEKHKKTLLGAPHGKRVIVFIDDVNMPKVEIYGAQPPIELLRQFLENGGLYDREKLFWKTIKDVVVACACVPPGGSGNVLTPRFVRHFGMLLIPASSEFTLKAIFKAIVKGFLSDFAAPVYALADSIVSAAVEIYLRIAVDLLPTPTKSHYVFNLRDLSKCVQGILQADSGTLREAEQMQRLFYHECLRVFHDRLVDDIDKTYFYHLMRDICNRNFGGGVLQLPDTQLIDNPPTLLFGDFMVLGASKENKFYEEIRDLDRMKYVLQDYLDDYNITSTKEMKLVFFLDALRHTARIARIIRAERGHALLVGVSGMGKQSLTKLSSHVNGYECFQIALTRSYDHSSFLEDMRKLYFNAGAKNNPTVFLFGEAQTVEEECLEDVNNMLNTGEVPNLFEADEYEKVINTTRSGAKEHGIAEGNRDGIYHFFIARVRRNLHLVICMSPVGDTFRRHCRMFPSLVNCCTIDWFSKWPNEALLSVALSTLKNKGSEQFVLDLSKMCMVIHESVERMAERFYDEMKRRYYTTPSSYLELLKLYIDMLDKREKQICLVRDKVANGLQKIYETNNVIDDMKEQLTKMKPILAEKSIAVAELMKYLVKEKKQVDQVRELVEIDQAEAKEKAAATQEIADDAQRDLDVALPAMEAATKALDSLNKNDINELKVFQKPPTLVRFVMESVCLLLGSKTDWATAKQILADVNFLRRLKEYDKDHIPEITIKKLKVYIDNKDFFPDIVAAVSKVCKSMCMWVRAIDTYAKVFKVVEPKRKRLAEAERELNRVMAILREKQRQLREVEEKIKHLEAQFEASVAEKKALEDNMALTAVRLVNADRLMIALGDEQLLWEETVASTGAELNNMLGDVLLAAACVSYLGPFTNNYRIELTARWLDECLSLKIPCSSNFNIINILGDQYEIRMWNSFGLPQDSVSTENAIIMTRAARWPLMIDPQEQANRWIKQMEAENDLKIVKMTDSNFSQILEASIRLGWPVLLEEIKETLDPSLKPILLKAIFIQGGRALIRLGDSDVEYDKNFKLYMTSKLMNPHYLPEICIQVTLINFLVNLSGLEEQLLADVVQWEKPQLEEQRTELITRINNDKSQMHNIEEKILKLLFASEGNILDDEELITTLNESKETASVISARLEEAEETEVKISTAREKYRTVATKGSILYFVVAQLSDIDPMYQYSLKYFNKVFNQVIETSEKSDVLPIRLEILHREITLSVYKNVSRGLFERHKLIFSFMLCVAILQERNEINDAQYNFLLRGAVGAKPPDYPKPDLLSVTEHMWTAVLHLHYLFESFRKLPDNFTKKIHITVGDFEQVIHLDPQAGASKYNFDEELDLFDKLILIKILKEEKLIFAVTEYVKTKLGRVFVESVQMSLHILYQDISTVTPLVFVLSTGSDPFGMLQRFATDVGFLDRIQSISLGQGQGPVAEKIIESGKGRGDWVFLQNCHLAASWMLRMEQIVADICNNVGYMHKDFRLYLSSMPCKSFPVSVLQNSVKVTTEAPKGIRSNLKRAFADMREEFYMGNPLGLDWRKMMFGICMFHAIIQERKKFGPLGWNITYEFNESDRDFSFNTIQMFCTDDTIFWDALEYIIGEIVYGGRVTDGWDLRCLKTILKGFFAPHTLEPGYTYSVSGVYYCPSLDQLQEYQEFIDAFPIIDEPEIFGMHENANIAFQIKETQGLINTILESQPSSSVKTEGKSPDEIVFDLACAIKEVLVEEISQDDPFPTMFKKDHKNRMPSLTTVLTQEVDRFNKLLFFLHTNMNGLKKAVKGFAVMSEVLEQVYKSFLNNKVPPLWSSRSYPSLKSLGSWVYDLELRIDFITIWFKFGHPKSYWLSGFYFTQGFLTGVLQTHSRKYDLPIDQLKFDFKIVPFNLDQKEIKRLHDEEGGKEVEDAYGNVHVPDNGVIIHGLYLDAGRWDLKNMLLVDPRPGEINPALPLVWFLPSTVLPNNDLRYVCPLYKTSVRAGTLSTTGHSTNFVIAIFLSSNETQRYWILKGTALLISLSD